MIRLLKIEFYKIIYNKSFWIILGLYVLFFMPIAYGIDNFFSSFSVGTERQTYLDVNSSKSSIFNFPFVWHNLAYLAGWFKLLLAIIIVILVTSEYSYKTLKQNIIDGMSKWEVIWAKELVILILSFIAVLFLVIVILVAGKSPDEVSFFKGSSVLLIYFLSLVVYLNFTYFLSLWLKKSGLVLGILFLYTLVIENVLTYKLPESISRYFIINLIDRLIPNPLLKIVGHDTHIDFSIPSLLVCFFYIAFFILLNHWLLKKGHVGKD